MQHTSAPLRHNGPGTQEPSRIRITVEIFLIIVDWISPAAHEMSTTEYRATFSALSLVCRMLRAECQPRLFRTLWFRGHPKTTRSEVFWNNLQGVDEDRCAILLGGVWDCTFYWWLNSAILDRALSKIIHSVDLTSLSLLRCSLSISTFTLIAALSGVRTLVLDRCEIQLSTTSTPIYTSRPKWTGIYQCCRPKTETYAHGSCQVFSSWWISGVWKFSLQTTST